jgi:nitrogen fixation-related uncharacterized protein
MVQDQFRYVNRFIHGFPISVLMFVAFVLLGITSMGVALGLIIWSLVYCRWVMKNENYEEISTPSVSILVDDKGTSYEINTESQDIRSK